MTPEIPSGFDLEQFYQGIYLFQKWEVVPGHVTSGPKDVVATLAAMDFPADLSGKRVLDIAPWNGFFSMECARRNAAEVVALGPEDPMATGFEQTRSLVSADQVRYVRDSVYNIDPAVLGTFDIVLFLGLIYHLRHPAWALDRIYDVCSGEMYCDTPVIDGTVYDKTVDEAERAAILQAGQVTNKLPMLYFTATNETGDHYNWFIPNALAFHGLVSSSGFDVVDQKHDGVWSWMKTTRGKRPFVDGLEGYNPGAAHCEQVAARPTWHNH